MHDPTASAERSAPKPVFYAQLAHQIEALLAGETDLIANAANTSAALFHALPEINWVGFYLLKDGELVVGPFQGKLACVRIPLGRGVCGTAAVERRTLLVANVHEFEGHIACDVESASELVVPLLREDGLIGVLDLDSPRLARFDEQDRAGLERIAQIFVAACAP